VGAASCVATGSSGEDELGEALVADAVAASDVADGTADGGVCAVDTVFASDPRFDTRVAAATPTTTTAAIPSKRTREDRRSMPGTPDSRSWDKGCAVVPAFRSVVGSVPLTAAAVTSWARSLTGPVAASGEVSPFPRFPEDREERGRAEAITWEIRSARSSAKRDPKGASAAANSATFA
jgi:hypothetical protein